MSGQYAQLQPEGGNEPPAGMATVAITGHHDEEIVNGGAGGGGGGHATAAAVPAPYSPHHGQQQQQQQQPQHQSQHQYPGAPAPSQFAPQQFHQPAYPPLQQHQHQQPQFYPQQPQPQYPMAYPVVAAPYAMALPPAGGVAYAGGAGGVNDGAAMLMPRVARGSWSDGLFDCFDSFTITLLACCITPYRWALTEERSHQALHHAPREGLFTKSLLWYGIPWALVFLLQVIWDATGAWWLVFLCLLCTVIQIWLGMRTRKRLREQYGIQGSECEDCMLHAFCRCCAVAQEARHVDRDLAIPI